MDRYRLDGHKLYWHLDRVCAWQKDRLIPPVYLEISPVSYCDHRCLFCGVDFARQRPARMETAVLCRVLGEMGREGVRSVMFSGEGEPLLHEDLPRMAAAAKESGLDVALTTNGARGDGALWQELLPFLSWVKFSVDAGTPEVYSRVHRVPGAAFAKTLESIREAVRIKTEKRLAATLGVQYLLWEENLPDLEEALRLFGAQGVNYLVVKPYSLHPQMLRPLRVAYRGELLQEVEKIVEKYRGRSNIEIFFRRGALEKYIRGEKDFAHCYALPFWGYISAKGDFYTCGVFLYDDRFRAGNLYYQSMKEILSGDARRRSIVLGERELRVDRECRLNCRMARVNEFFALLEEKPAHVNFI